MDLTKIAMRTGSIRQPKVADTSSPARRPGRPRMKDSLPIDPNDNTVGSYLRAKLFSLAFAYSK
jgi:hypothetical protein